MVSPSARIGCFKVQGAHGQTSAIDGGGRAHGGRGCGGNRRNRRPGCPGLGLRRIGHGIRRTETRFDRIGRIIGDGPDSGGYGRGRGASQIGRIGGCGRGCGLNRCEGRRRIGGLCFRSGGHRVGRA